MHLRNPFTGEVSTLESIVKDSYEQLGRDEVDPDDWAEVDPEGKEHFLYANKASGEMSTLSDCLDEFDIDRDFAVGQGVDGREHSEPYFEVVMDVEGYWKGADGSQLAAPYEWQHELIELTQCRYSDQDIADEQCERLLQESKTKPNNWVIHEASYVAIREAAKQGHEDMCRMLLATGADFQSGFTPLHGAASIGHVGIAQMMLDAGANPNAVEDEYVGMTPLHLAAGNGESEVGLLLLRHGADPEEKTQNGDTCIVYAYRASDDVLGEAFKAHVAEKRAVKLEAAWGSTQPTKDNLQAAQPTQAAPAITTGRRPKF